MTLTCKGLPAEWLTGWLAAIGITKLEPRIELSWTPGAKPRAVLSGTVDIVGSLLASWPSEERIQDMPIATEWEDTATMDKFNVPVEVFQERVQASLQHRDAWTLSSTMTDLFVHEKKKVKLTSNSRFNVRKGGGGTIYPRLVKLTQNLDISKARIQASLNGTGQHVSAYGLGFDLPSLYLSDTVISAGQTDPAISILAFFGLSLFPCGGNGVPEPKKNAGKSRRNNLFTRGWGNDKDGQFAFFWPAWSKPLDYYAIDALLSLWDPGRKDEWELLGITQALQTVPFVAEGSDRRIGYGSRKI